VVSHGYGLFHMVFTCFNGLLRGFTWLESYCVVSHGKGYCVVSHGYGMVSYGYGMVSHGYGMVSHV